MKTSRRTFLGGASAAAFLSSSRVSFGQKKYDDGASDSEIKIGHTCPYSGPASAYGVNGKAIVAFWDMINDTGGINGRKIKFITLDDGYSPPKTVECIRQLVEQEKVLCTHNTLGTACNTAIHKYMNQKKVPQLYVATGASKWGNPKDFPWTMGYQPDYHTEAVIYAKHILSTVKDARIARADAERRLRQGLLGRLQGRPRAGGRPGRQARHLRDHRPHGRFAGHPAQGERRQRLLQHRHAQVRRPGDAQGGRHRLAARALRQQCLGERRHGDEAGRLRQRAGHRHRGLRHGSDRSDLDRARGHEGVQGMDGQVPSDGAPGRSRQRQRLHRVVPDGRDAAALRRRADARQRHEAGRVASRSSACPCCCRASRSRPARPTTTRSRPCSLQRFKGQTWELFGEIMHAEGS